MSRPLDAFEPARPLADDRPGLLSAPPEGWMSAAALLVMMLFVAFAVDDATWVGWIRGTTTTQTSFLPVAIVLAVIAGGLLGRSTLRPLTAHVVGALAGAVFLLVAVAGSISRAPALEERLQALNQSISGYLWDTLALGIRSDETSGFMLLLGSLLWAAAQLGAFHVFRNRRAMPAIALGAAILLINMSVTTREQLPHLVVFGTAALLLLVRLNLLNETENWRSRRIADAGYAGELFLRRGAVFVSVAVVASLLLAGTASSAPLSRAWRDMDSRVLEVGYAINRWLGGVSGPIRGSTNLFGPTQTLRDVWESSGQLVFTARVGDDDAHYWRGSTYDSFDGRTWQQLDALTRLVAAGDSTLEGSAESMSDVAGRRQLAITITSANLGGDYMVVPESPLLVDRTTELATHLGDGGFVSLRMADGLREGTQYSALSLVPRTTGGEAVTASRLAAAGTDYQPWLGRYLEIRPGSIGPRAYEEADRIVARLAPERRNPYHIAEAIQNWFWRDGGFEYQTDVRGLCIGEDLIECFLDVKKGYCERFATAMTMMLRTQGIPARYVVGYLPGQRAGEGLWNVHGSAAHAWVEVYFPGYGWYRFDPTPGNTENGQQPTMLRDGAPVPSARPGTASLPSPSGRDPRDDDFDRTDDVPAPILPTPGAGPTEPDPALPLALALILVVSALLVLVARTRRLPPLEAGRAYAGVTRLATRLGHGPRPTQTVFEFTDGLARLVPAVATDLRTLALAKVELSYAGRPPARGLGQRLSIAYRRVRVGMLRLVLRRPRLSRQPSEIRDSS